MKRKLDSAQMITHYLFECSLPRQQAWNLAIENKSISFIPYAPGAYHNHFHEKRIGEFLFGSEQLFVDVAINTPGNPQIKPPSN